MKSFLLFLAIYLVYFSVTGCDKSTEPSKRQLSLMYLNIAWVWEDTLSVVRINSNIIVSTGDILNMATNSLEPAFINGRNVSHDNKHKRLSSRFQTKYDNMKS